MLNNVKEIRTNNGMSQKDLAHMCNVSRQTIHSIESSKYQPTITLALKIATVLQSSVEEVFILEEED